MICIEILRSRDAPLLRVITMKAATFSAVYPASVCRDYSAPEITSKVPLCSARNRFARKPVHEGSVVSHLIDRKCEKRTATIRDIAQLPFICGTEE